MAIFTVTTAADIIDATDGKLSLREAIRQANASADPDRIVFASGLEGKTLTLTQGELIVKQDVTIDGDQNNDNKEVTLSGGDVSRIIHVTGDGSDVTITDLSLAHGRTTADFQGGGALRGEDGTALYLRDATVRDSGTFGFRSEGGGIFGHSVKLTSSTVTGNSTTGDQSIGGGIYGQTVRIYDTSIHDNTTHGDFSSGGGIKGGIVEVFASRIDSNTINGFGCGGGVYGNYVTLSSGIVSNNNSQDSDGGGIYGGNVTVNNSIITSNGTQGSGASGGGIFGRIVTLNNSLVINNNALGGGGGVYGTNFKSSNSTITGNRVEAYEGGGGGVFSINALLLNTTISGNYDRTQGGGISAFGHLETTNSIVAGNFVGLYGTGPDVVGPIAVSNGHNIFGSDVLGAVIGDLQGVAPSLLFAAIDPDHGGGQTNSAGIIPLRNTVDNPALGGGDPLAALPTDQVGTTRPLPAGSLPDIGAAERNQAQSTHPSMSNDLVIGTEASNTIAGQGGADLISGLGGNDKLSGEAGSDLLDGGKGNDLLDGGDGIDFVRFGGNEAVSIDLAAGTARRGTEIDRLTSVQGAIGSSAEDTFHGDAGPNWFQGGLGRDVASGEAGRDVYDFDRIQDSLPGATNRDLITDFALKSDKLDLTAIDADTTAVGNQAFQFVEKAGLTGPGEIGFFISGGNTIIRASNDADAATEFEIQLTGIKVLTATDFYL